MDGCRWSLWARRCGSLGLLHCGCWFFFWGEGWVAVVPAVVLLCSGGSLDVYSSDLLRICPGSRGANNSTKQQLSESWRNWILAAIEMELTEVEFDSELFEIAKNRKHMEKMVETYSDLFIMSKTNGRIVLTQGVAGIGKTFHTRRLMVDWAKQKSNTHIDLIVPLHFGELNATRGEVQSIQDILDNFLNDAEQPQVSTYEECKMAFIIDGLENCPLPLNFKKNKKLTKVTERASMDVLLTNLIKGNLFPRAVLWIISQPSGVKKIPAKYIDKVLVCKEIDAQHRLTEIGKNGILAAYEMELIETETDSELYMIDTNNEDEEQLVKTYNEIFTDLKKKTYPRQPSSCSALEKPDFASQRKLKAQLKEHFTYVCEGIDQQKTSALLKDIYTDLYIIEGERAQHECRQVQGAKFKPEQEETPIRYCDIFKPSPVNTDIKTVLTIGMAGIGKTFASLKYILDWAEGTATENIFYTFPLPFRELNLRNKEEHSLEDLIHQFFPAMKTSEITDYDKYEILIVLDGLDECRIDLEFNESNHWTDVRKQASVSVLLSNLILGNLLPKAQIWITSRPAASNNIPAEKVDRMTEVRGFNDEQKEEYFQKKFSDKEQAEKILKHVKQSRSLYIMCHIPVFCWITSKGPHPWACFTIFYKKSSGIRLYREQKMRRDPDLDLSHNDLQDSGVQLLAEGLKSLHCKLEDLNLSGCQVTEKGCDFLASALKSNKVSKLKQLDLSYNHCGEYGMSVLNAISDDPTRKLEALCFDYNGPHQLKPGMKKYAANLTLDEKTAGRRLLVSENNREAKTVLKVDNCVSRQVNKDRFKRTQVFCEESLKSTCYWEVEWKGMVGIAVAYKTVSKKLDSCGGLGCNDWSWSLLCSKTECTALHGKNSIKIRTTPCHKIAVLLDWEGGSLSYFNVLSEELSLIHTFYAKFTEELFPGFWFRAGSITLCHI
ncbi:hypothetical protein CRENBAI_012964 [Crenichthys baileyi]|uniref:Uncharacterized protein n=1 Tax=Crenichthys baileyi TaxID=28760 RepID=A0AAV9QVV1_9TELE